VLSLELQRARNESAAHLGFADPNAPALQLAPTPAVSILDRPPLPSGEDDHRPRALVFASPWFGAHHIYAGASATQRGASTQAPIMGELGWSLWPGPVDRCDEGNVTRSRASMSGLMSGQSRWRSSRRPPAGPRHNRAARSAVTLPHAALWGPRAPAQGAGAARRCGRCCDRLGAVRAARRRFLGGLGSRPWVNRRKAIAWTFSRAAAPRSVRPTRWALRLFLQPPGKPPISGRGLPRCGFGSHNGRLPGRQG